MAKRRNKQQIDADAIIKAHLNVLGDIVHAQATETSRRKTGRLQDEQNFQVRPDTVLTFGQLNYGQWNYPKGSNTGEKNALLIAINEHIGNTTDVIIKSITDELLKDFKNE